MAIYLFYVSDRGGEGRQAVKLPDGGQAFIRIERANAANDMDALDEANIRPEEQFMNSHSLDALGADIPEGTTDLTPKSADPADVQAFVTSRRATRDQS